jgi:hypothetical protein
MRDTDSELVSVRLALLDAYSENATLRAELDRLTLSDPNGRRTAGGDLSQDARQAVTADDSIASGAAPRGLLVDLANRYREGISRVVAGDEAAGDEAYEAVIELVRSGPEAFPVLRDAYLSTPDPAVRAVMIRALVSGHGAEAQEFVLSQLQSEADPDLRQALIVHAARLATPATVPLFRDVFLETLGSKADAEARLAAIRGLRYARGDPAAEEALLAATSDAADDVRLAALEALVSRRDLHDALRDVIAGEASSRVQAIGQCRLLLAQPAVKE